MIKVGFNFLKNTFNVFEHALKNMGTYIYVFMLKILAYSFTFTLIKRTKKYL